MNGNLVTRIAILVGIVPLFWFTNQGCQSTGSSGDRSSPPANEKISGTIEDGMRVVHVTAKKYKYTPNPIVVHQGEKVRLELTSDDVTHGLAIGEYKIDKAIEPGKTTTVEFTADKSGTYGFHCSFFCGMSHMKMRGQLVVLPAEKQAP